MTGINFAQSHSGSDVLTRIGSEKKGYFKCPQCVTDADQTHSQEQLDVLKYQSGFNRGLPHAKLYGVLSQVLSGLPKIIINRLLIFYCMIEWEFA